MTRPGKTPLEMKACKPSNSALAAHPCQNVIPFYPVRYALRPNASSGYDYEHSNLRSKFPKVPEIAYVLRMLRPESWLYLYDPDNRHKLVCFVYRAGEQATPKTCYYYRVDIDVATGEHFLLTEPHTNPYVPAYQPRHPPQQIRALLTDAPLSAARTLELIEDEAVRKRSTQPIDLAPWLASFRAVASTRETPSYPAVADTLPVMELERQLLELRGQNTHWSEHPTFWTPSALAGHDAAMKRRSAEALGGTRLAIVFNDPIGMLSELNHLLEEAQERLNTFHAITARPLRSAAMVEALAMAAQEHGYRKGREDDLKKSAKHGLPPNTGAIVGQRYREKRLLDVRDGERTEFLRRYQTDLNHYTRLRNASKDRPAIFRTAHRKNLDAAMALYDPADDIGQAALRDATARTLGFCMVDEETAAELAEPLEDEGPTSGPFKAVIFGHPTFAAWVNSPKALEFGVTTGADSRLEQLREVNARVSANASSQRLNLMISVLLSQNRKMALETFWRSPYAAAAQAMEGSLVTSQSLTDANQVARWLEDQRQQLKLASSKATSPPQRQSQAARNTPAISHNPPPRPTALSHGINSALQLLHEESIYDKADTASARINQPEATARESLRWKASTWQAGKVSFTGLGLWIGVSNVSESINKLHRADATLAIEGMGLAGDVLSVGASGSSLTHIAADWKRDMAALRGDRLAAESSRLGALRAEKFAIGFAGFAAASYAIRDLMKVRNDWQELEKAPEIRFVGAGMQVTAAGLAGAWLAGRLIDEDLLARFGARSLTRLGSGPVGWGLFTLEMTYHAVTAWRKWTEAENEINTWLARSYWGTGERNGSNTREIAAGLSTEKVSHYESDREEMHAFLSMSHKPRIESKVAVMGAVAAQLVSPALATFAQRTIKVTFPRWQPGVSRYRIWQHPDPRGSGRPVVYEGDTGVVQEDENWVKTFDAYDLAGDTQVAWWPGGIGALDDLFFEAEI